MKKLIQQTLASAALLLLGVSIALAQTVNFNGATFDINASFRQTNTNNWAFWLGSFGVNDQAASAAGGAAATDSASPNLQYIPAITTAGKEAFTVSALLRGDFANTGVGATALSLGFNEFTWTNFTSANSYVALKLVGTAANTFEWNTSVWGGNFPQGQSVTLNSSNWYLISVTFTKSAAAGTWNWLARVSDYGPTGLVLLSTGSTASGTLAHTSTFNAANLYAAISFTAGATNSYVDNFTVAAGAATPAAPSNLTATAGDAQVSLSWTASPGAASYTIKRSTTAGTGYSTVSSGTVTGTSFTDTGLTNGTPYYYLVSAVSAAESAHSSEASATPVASSAGAENLVTFNSAAFNTNALFRQTTSGNFVSWSSSAGITDQVGPIAGGGLAAANVSPTLQYIPVVNTAAKDTFTVSSLIKGDFASAGTNITAAGLGISQFTWTDFNSSNSYVALKLIGNGTNLTWHTSIWGANYPQSASLTLNSTNWYLVSATFTKSATSGTWNWSGSVSDYGVSGTTLVGTLSTASGTIFHAATYGSASLYGAVTFTGGASGSVLDNFSLSAGIAPPTAPAAPANLVATAGVLQTSLSWTASVGAATYTIKRSTTSGSGYATISSGIVTGTTFTDTGLTSGTPYYYVVSAVASGESPDSSEATSTPLSALQGWRQLKFSTTDNSGSAADLSDPDADGRTNLLEYATGTEPLAADSGPAATPGQSLAGKLTLSFNRIADPALTYTVRGSNDLTAAWNEAPVFTSTGVANTAGSVTAEDTVTTGSQPRRFLRLEISY